MSVGYIRRWIHRDLVAGRCTAEDYMADLMADVDARFDQAMFAAPTANAVTVARVGWVERLYLWLTR